VPSGEMDGRSHCPEEWTDPDHISAGVHLLTATLLLLGRATQVEGAGTRPALPRAEPSRRPRPAGDTQRARSAGSDLCVGRAPDTGVDVLESSFATVRLRTKVSKGAGSRAAGLAMVFKVVESAQARWRAVNGAHLATSTLITQSMVLRWETTPRLSISEAAKDLMCNCDVGDLA